MAILKAINSGGKRSKNAKPITKSQNEYTFKYLVTSYIPEKTEGDEALLSGINMIGNTANDFYNEMKSVKDQYQILRTKDKDRLYKHYVISYSKDECERFTPRQLHKISEEAVRAELGLSKEYQIELGTHINDKNQIHTHILVNTVNINTGKKLHLQKEFLNHFKKQTNKVFLSYGMDIQQKTDNLAVYSTKVYQAKEMGKMLKIDQVAKDIEKIANSTINRYLFINKLLENGYKIRWVKDGYKYDQDLKKEVPSTDNKHQTNKISITTPDGEKYRLETLYKNTQIEFTQNKDLIDHFNKIKEQNENKIFISSEESKSLKEDYKSITVLQPYLNKLKDGLATKNYYSLSNLKLEQLNDVYKILVNTARGKSFVDYKLDEYIKENHIKNISDKELSNITELLELKIKINILNSLSLKKDKKYDFFESKQFFNSVIPPKHSYSKELVSEDELERRKKEMAEKSSGATY